LSTILRMMTDATGGYPPLDGLVVLDLSRVLAGPYAAMLLGDLGARVIEVKRPEVGDDTIWRRFATNERRVPAGDELRRLVGEALAGRDVEEWLRLFDEHGVPAGEIKSLDRVYSSEQVISQGLICEVEHPKLGEIRLPGPPIQFGRSTSREHTAPPLLDEHGEEIRQWSKTSEPTEATSDHRAGG
jgi:crotonobetainyl-CoA:carnitine CoA-transferase CaiB-like acyl-CoA transferase